MEDGGEWSKRSVWKERLKEWNNSTRREKNRLKIKDILVISLDQKFEDFLDKFENYYFFLEIFPAKNTIFDFDDRIYIKIYDINKLQPKYKREKDICTIVVLLEMGKKIYLQNLVARWKILVSRFKIGLLSSYSLERVH